ncbi:MAG: hypothetical protein ACKVW3_17765 [Phycisphaerales bacterium]
MLATFREDDADPKERFVYHAAGLGGYGGSSYIDDVICRDRDYSTDWYGEDSDGVLETRAYYCQNWRHDVSAIVTSGGHLRAYSFQTPPP